MKLVIYVAVYLINNVVFPLVIVDSPHTEDTWRSWHVDSICLQERYSEYVIKFSTPIYLNYTENLNLSYIAKICLYTNKTFKIYIQCH